MTINWMPSEGKMRAVGHDYPTRHETVTTPGEIERLRAEVAMLRKRNAELAAQRLELDERTYYDGRVAELEAMLRHVQWAADEQQWSPLCPVCFEPPQNGHAADCDLAALLGEREG